MSNTIRIQQRYTGWSEFSIPKSVIQESGLTLKEFVEKEMHVEFFIEDIAAVSKFKNGPRDVWVDTDTVNVKSKWLLEES